MPAKKTSKPAKKPVKPASKKPVAKAAAPRKPARPSSKPSAKPASVKAKKPTARAAVAKAPATVAKAPSAGAKSPAAAAKAAPATSKLPAKSPAPAAKGGGSAAHGASEFDVRPLVSALRAADDDTDYEAHSSSLLAGPRNVKPYIPRRGEQYMSSEQLEHFAQILQNWKRDLMVEVDRTVLHMKDEAANFPDPNDRATQEEEFSLELRTRDRERKLIRKIDEALKRIEDGSYGYCLETGEEIGIKRLEARPVATLSIEAQERRERRERQYGDRDDRYR